MLLNLLINTGSSRPSTILLTIYLYLHQVICLPYRQVHYRSTSLPLPQIGVSLCGCLSFPIRSSGVQLSRYRLGCFREYLRFSSGHVDTETAPTRSKLPGPLGDDLTVGPVGSLVPIPPPAHTETPSPENCSISVVRPRPGLP